MHPLREGIVDDNSDIDFLNSVHSSGVLKSQTTPADACKDDSAQLIINYIYPLRPGTQVSNHLSSIFGCFEVDEGKPLHLSETDILLRQNDFHANPENQVILKFMRDHGLIPAYLEHQMGIDATYVVPSER